MHVIHKDHLIPVASEMLKTDIIGNMQLTADKNNPLRVFMISTFANTYLDKLLSSLADANGLIPLPSKEAALESLKLAGGMLPFEVPIPMGLSFTVKIGKDDFEKFYSAVEDKLQDAAE